MPRTRTIPWEVRLSIFLDFRQLKKVYPTAKRHGIARSTVSAIVEEFREMGFSLAPRPELSAKVLTLAQEHHISAVMESLQQAQLANLTDPREGLRGGLTPEDALGEQAGPLAAQMDPLPLDEAVTWHLKGTEAGQMVQEARKAIRVYSQRCLELWREIRTDVEGVCRLPVRTYCGPDQRGPGPHIFHTMVDEIYKAMLNGPSRSGKSAEDLPCWNLAQNSPSVLRTGGTEVAVGGPEDHQRVKLGVESLHRNKSRDYAQRLLELTRLYQDLKYVKEISAEALGSATLEEIRGSVCPACPYPEAHLAPGPDDD